MSDTFRLLALTVGNTRTRWGLFEGTELVESHSVLNADAGAMANQLTEQAMHAELAVIASVNDPVAKAAEHSLVENLDCEIAWINRDIGVPLTHILEEPITVGADRVLCALAAWDRTKQACVVIDAGTAITVDLIDGKGTFQGGAILPGGLMMLQSLRAGTAQLPDLAWPPASIPKHALGQTTAEAIIHGAIAAARGGVRYLIETYSEFYGGYPQIVATGGDAPLLFENDGIVEHIIPDLQLIGVRLSVAHARGETGEQEDDEG